MYPAGGPVNTRMLIGSGVIAADVRAAHRADEAGHGIAVACGASRRLEDLDGQGHERRRGRRYRSVRAGDGSRIDNIGAARGNEVTRRGIILFIPGSGGQLGKALLLSRDKFLLANIDRLDVVDIGSNLHEAVGHEAEHGNEGDGHDPERDGNLNE